MRVKRRGWVGLSCWTWATSKPWRWSNRVQKSKVSLVVMASSPRGRKGCQVSLSILCVYGRSQLQRSSRTAVPTPNAERFHQGGWPPDGRIAVPLPMLDSVGVLDHFMGHLPSDLQEYPLRDRFAGPKQPSNRDSS